MKNKSIFAYTDKRITICALILVIFGSLMIASAEMGNNAGDTAYLTRVIGRQLVYVIIGIAAYFVLLLFRVYRFKTYICWTVYIGILGSLLICRAFGQINGAYAWIRIGAGATIQPSEFAKIMVILITAAYCGDVKRTYKNDYQMVRRPLLFIGAYIFIVMVLQSDLGSAVVIGFISVFCLLIPNHPQMKRLQRQKALQLRKHPLQKNNYYYPYGEAIGIFKRFLYG